MDTEHDDTDDLTEAMLRPLLRLVTIEVCATRAGRYYAHCSACDSSIDDRLLDLTTRKRDAEIAAHRHRAEHHADDPPQITVCED